MYQNKRNNVKQDCKIGIKVLNKLKQRVQELIMQKKYVHANKVIKAAFELDNNDAELHFLQANIIREAVSKSLNFNINNAFVHYEKALAIKPNNFNYNKGLLEMLLMKYLINKKKTNVNELKTRIDRMLEKMSIKFNNNSEALIFVALTYYNLGKFNLSHKFFNQVKKYQEFYVTANFYLYKIENKIAMDAVNEK